MLPEVTCEKSFFFLLTFPKICAILLPRRNSPFVPLRVLTAACKVRWVERSFFLLDIFNLRDIMLFRNQARDVWPHFCEGDVFKTLVSIFVLLCIYG